MEHLIAEFWGWLGVLLGAFALAYAVKADAQLAELLKAVRGLKNTRAE